MDQGGVVAVEGIEKINAAGTSAGNYDLDTAEICSRIEEWGKLCKLQVVSADRASVQLSFDTLPDDMGSFASAVYSFCPDVVDQGTGCVAEMIELMGVPENMKGIVEDIDFSDDTYGIEILKRLVSRDRQLSLWWD